MQVSDSKGPFTPTASISRPVHILGIETSCDETACAVLDNRGSILSSIVASQLDVHQLYGGVVPELASREHMRGIVPVVRATMDQAGIGYADLDAVAVTAGPGLMGALLVGATFAKGIAFSAGLPLIAVNHLEGHVHAVLLEARQQHQEIAFPALALIVSGGHTHLFYSEDEGKYQLLGRTRDDAVGEAYDKVAVTLGFGYPGGPTLDAIAAHGTAERGTFTVPSMKGNALDFSFSGLKTAVLRWKEAHEMESEIAGRKALLSRTEKPTIDDWLELTPVPTRNLIASFQQTILDHLETNCLSALSQTGARSMIVSGGVASNRGLRTRFGRPDFPAPCYFPVPSLSTDNAVMVAAAAFPKLKRQEFSPLSFSPEPGLRLDVPSPSL
jgi:N6-L-threonylcarbamoyladenine synthase